MAQQINRNTNIAATIIALSFLAVESLGLAPLSDAQYQALFGLCE